MTENTLTRTPNRLILPNDIPAGIHRLYNGLKLVDLYRKGNFLGTFGKLGVRRVGKFKDYSDFFSFFHSKLWEWVFKQVIETNSVVELGKTRVMLKSYQFKHHLNPDLFVNQFRLTVPIFKRGHHTHLIWVTKQIIEDVNTPGKYADQTPRVYRQADVKAHMMSIFPQFTIKQINEFVSFSIQAMHRFVKNNLNPTVRYNNTLCVVGVFDFRFKQSEGVGFEYHRKEIYRDKQLKQFVQHVKRNYN